MNITSYSELKNFLDPVIIPSLITHEQAFRLANVIRKEAEPEPKIAGLTKSLGYYNLPEAEFLYDIATPILEDYTKSKLVKQNTYSRVYFKGDRLDKHTDTENLQITMTVALSGSSDCKQQLKVMINDKCIPLNLNNGDAGVIFLGNYISHFREVIECQELICTFVHWSFSQ